ncbi:hypothetical protein FA15DRAFT_272928 [Coprinopsis marcescibilis]|uniref:Uncharacterized protein n=1 Tax=Coprinopsis marcescibilis TaxID=230819 RepID=A0A5C3LDW4_COPMA|nr:hypothetical protein FA15DRAFT_272928 [Coprinopsis marcescibilis]
MSSIRLASDGDNRPATVSSNTGMRTATSGPTSRGALGSQKFQNLRRKHTLAAASSSALPQQRTMADPHRQADPHSHSSLSAPREPPLSQKPQTTRPASRQAQPPRQPNVNLNSIAPVQETVSQDLLHLLQKVLDRTDEMRTESTAFRTVMTARIESLETKVHAETEESKKLHEQLRRFYNLQAKSNAEWSASFKSLKKWIGQGEEGDERSLMTRVDALGFTVGDIWERSKDAGANKDGQAPQIIRKEYNNVALSPFKRSAVNGPEKTPIQVEGTPSAEPLATYHTQERSVAALTAEGEGTGEKIQPGEQAAKATSSEEDIEMELSYPEEEEEEEAVHFSEDNPPTVSQQIQTEPVETPLKAGLSTKVDWRKSLDPIEERSESSGITTSMGSFRPAMPTFSLRSANWGGSNPPTEGSVSELRMPMSGDPSFIGDNSLLVTSTPRANALLAARPEFSPLPSPSPSRSASPRPSSSNQITVDHSSEPKDEEEDHTAEMSEHEDDVDMDDIDASKEQPALVVAQATPPSTRSVSPQQANPAAKPVETESHTPLRTPEPSEHEDDVQMEEGLSKESLPAATESVAAGESDHEFDESTVGDDEEANAQVVEHTSADAVVEQLSITEDEVEEADPTESFEQAELSVSIQADVNVPETGEFETPGAEEGQEEEVDQLVEDSMERDEDQEMVLDEPMIETLDKQSDDGDGDEQEDSHDNGLATLDSVDMEQPLTQEIQELEKMLAPGSSPRHNAEGPPAPEEPLFPAEPNVNSDDEEASEAPQMIPTNDIEIPSDVDEDEYAEAVWLSMRMPSSSPLRQPSASPAKASRGPHVGTPSRLRQVTGSSALDANDVSSFLLNSSPSHSQRTPVGPSQTRKSVDLDNGMQDQDSGSPSPSGSAGLFLPDAEDMEQEGQEGLRDVTPVAQQNEEDRSRSPGSPEIPLPPNFNLSFSSPNRRSQRGTPSPFKHSTLKDPEPDSVNPALLTKKNPMPQQTTPKSTTARETKSPSINPALLTKTPNATSTPQDTTEPPRTPQTILAHKNLATVAAVPRTPPRTPARSVPSIFASVTPRTQARLRKSSVGLARTPSKTPGGPVGQMRSVSTPSPLKKSVSREPRDNVERERSVSRAMSELSELSRSATPAHPEEQAERSKRPSSTRSLSMSSPARVDRDATVVVEQGEPEDVFMEEDHVPMDVHQEPFGDEVEAGNGDLNMSEADDIFESPSPVRRKKDNKRSVVSDVPDSEDDGSEDSPPPRPSTIANRSIAGPYKRIAPVLPQKKTEKQQSKTPRKSQPVEVIEIRSSPEKKEQESPRLTLQKTLERKVKKMKARKGTERGSTATLSVATGDVIDLTLDSSAESDTASKSTNTTKATSVKTENKVQAKGKGKVDTVEGEEEPGGDSDSDSDSSVDVGIRYMPKKRSSGAPSSTQPVPSKMNFKEYRKIAEIEAATRIKRKSKGDVDDRPLKKARAMSLKNKEKEKGQEKEKDRDRVRSAPSSKRSEPGGSITVKREKVKGAMSQSQPIASSSKSQSASQRISPPRKLRKESVKWPLPNQHGSAKFQKELVKCDK